MCYSDGDTGHLKLLLHSCYISILIWFNSKSFNFPHPTYVRLAEQFLCEQTRFLCRKSVPKFIFMNSTRCLQSLVREAGLDQMAGSLDNCKPYKYIGHLVQGITTNLVQTRTRRAWVEGLQNKNRPLNRCTLLLHCFPCSALIHLPSPGCFYARPCSTTEV